MKSVTEHIRTLLYEHDYVTIPNFGAFIANYLPSSFNEISGSLMPPQKRLAFNEILKQDDGLLATHISRRERVTIDEAKRKIQSFVSEIKNSLANEKTFSFDRVGDFVLNEESSLVFEPNRKNNFYSESFGFDSLFPRQIVKEKYNYTQNFEEDAEDLSVYQSSYSNTKTRKSFAWAYVLYSFPVILLSAGLLTVLLSSPQIDTQVAKSSFNPLDYIPEKEFAANEIEIIKPNFNKKLDVSPETLPQKKLTEQKYVTVPVNLKDRYLLVSGVFRSSENVRKLHLLLQSNGFSPSIISVGKLSKVIAAEVGSYDEAAELAQKHIKLTGEKPAIIKVD